MYSRDALRTNHFTVLHFKRHQDNTLAAGKAAIRRHSHTPPRRFILLQCFKTRGHLTWWGNGAKSSQASRTPQPPLLCLLFFCSYPPERPVWRKLRATLMALANRNWCRISTTAFSISASLPLGAQNRLVGHRNKASEFTDWNKNIQTFISNHIRYILGLIPKTQPLKTGNF